VFFKSTKKIHGSRHDYWIEINNKEACSSGVVEWSPFNFAKLIPFWWASCPRPSVYFIPNFLA